MKQRLASALGLGVVMAWFPAAAYAVPYASGVVKSGTTVNFVLNEPADSLTYTINGGPAQILDGTTKGAKSFVLPSTTAAFSIIAEKNAAVGFTIPTGGTMPSTTTSLTQASPQAGLNIISDDSSALNRFNSPRGVDVSRNPNAPHFGTAYVTNSAAGTATATIAPNPILPERILSGEGLYALKADGSDAFGFGDAGQNPGTNQDGFPAFSTASPNSPFRVTVAPNGDLYVADYSDINGTVFKLNPNLAGNSDIVLAGIGGPGYDPATGGTPLFPDGTSIPPGQNHGSISAVHIEGSLAGGDLVVYGVDEDINSAHFGGALQNDRNSVWQWNVGGTANSSVTPTKIGGGMIGSFPAGGIVIDMQRGADGKFYLSQNRSAGLQVGIQVLDATGVEVFNSLTKTREISGIGTTPDIFANAVGLAISPDQNWLAAELLNNDIAIVPLVNGIPDIENRMVIDVPLPTAGNGRDVAFDAAGNLHYVSSGQGVYRVLAPGGHSIAYTSSDGTNFDFAVETVDVGEDDADFDGDGDIDGADFLTWQRNLGTGDQTLGDADGNGTIDNADLDIWKGQFGTSTVAAGAVPEPATWAMFVVAAMAGVAATAPRRRMRLAVQAA